MNENEEEFVKLQKRLEKDLENVNVESIKGSVKDDFHKLNEAKKELDESVSGMREILKDFQESSTLFDLDGLSPAEVEFISSTLARISPILDKINEIELRPRDLEILTKRVEALIMVEQVQVSHGREYTEASTLEFIEKLCSILEKHLKIYRDKEEVEIEVDVEN